MDVVSVDLHLNYPGLASCIRQSGLLDLIFVLRLLLVAALSPWDSLSYKAWCAICFSLSASSFSFSRLSIKCKHFTLSACSNFPLLVLSSAKCARCLGSSVVGETQNVGFQQTLQVLLYFAEARK